MNEWMNEEKKYVLIQKILIGQNSTKRNEKINQLFPPVTNDDFLL